MRSFRVGLLLISSIACAAGCREANKVEAETRAEVEPVAAPAIARAAEQPAAPQAVCGATDLPDCPLQRWMKGTLQAYQRAGDYDRMGHAFSELAEHAPAGYDTWRSLAERGVALAANKDDAAIKQVCKDCHQNHRAHYRRERRAAPVW